MGNLTVVTITGNHHKPQQSTTNDHKPPTSDQKPPTNDHKTNRNNQKSPSKDHKRGQASTNHQQTTINYHQTNINSQQTTTNGYPCRSNQKSDVSFLLRAPVNYKGFLILKNIVISAKYVCVCVLGPGGGGGGLNYKGLQQKYANINKNCFLCFLAERFMNIPTSTTKQILTSVKTVLISTIFK